MKKLFIWDDVLYDYTAGIMFALADTVEDARRLLAVECDYLNDDILKEPKVYDLSEDVARVIWGGS